MKLYDRGKYSHPSCNLRVRNGISPVFALLDAGVVVGLGMDDKGFADDKDFVEEMRVASKLHRLPSHRLDSDHVLPRDCFRMGTEYGAMVLGFSSLVGTLEVGKKADVVILDTSRMEEPFVHPGHDPIDLLIYRGRAADVETVLVGGEVLLRNRELTKIDREEVIRRLRESISETYAGDFARYSELNAGLRQEIAAYFGSWYAEMDGIEKSPYYFMNNRY